MLFLAVLVALAVPAVADTWKKQTFPNRSERYSYHLREASCIINIFPNGDVEIHANGYKDQKPVCQVVRLTSHGVTNISKTVMIDRAQIVISEGHDIFQNKFARLTEQLPPDVQNKLSNR